MYRSCCLVVIVYFYGKEILKDGKNPIQMRNILTGGKFICTSLHFLIRMREKMIP